MFQLSYFYSKSTFEMPGSAWFVDVCIPLPSFLVATVGGSLVLSMSFSTPPHPVLLFPYPRSHY